jgi:surfeit locus 1 family protein
MTTPRRVPIFATIIVLAAVATMIGLGIWQLGRKVEKEALIARYERALGDDATVIFTDFAEPDAVFHRTEFLCEDVSRIEPVSGRNAEGRSGWVYVARCTTGGPKSFAPLEMTDYVLEPVDVSLGWSRQIQQIDWSGGRVSGRVISPGEQWGRVVADPPLAGLEPNAKPDPGDLPNNHLAYAGQWFFFALTALIIYVLALRRRRG